MRKSSIRSALFALVLATAGCSSQDGNVFITLDYDASSVRYRVGEAIAPNAPILNGSFFTNYVVNPALPNGLLLDLGTGEITGTPTAESAETVHVISADFEGETLFSSITIAVGPQLPASFLTLAEGFAVDEIASGLAIPARMARAPDGRLFFVELETGNVRIIDATDALLPAPFATLPVVTGGSRGLFGLALSPTFGSNGFVYVAVASPAGGGDPERTRIVRFTDVADLGTSETELVDDLPLAATTNGGDLVFDPSGNMFISIGDNEDPANAQSTTSLAGKVLRFTAAGAIPATNPTPGSEEWCKGLRDTLGLAIHPGTGTLFGADSGDTEDELNFLAPGKNFEWGDTTGTLTPAVVGVIVATWSPQIGPAAMVFHPGGGGLSDLQNDLFVAARDAEDIRQLKLSGGSFTEFDEEIIFAAFASSGDDNKPLDIEVDSDGSILVSTHTAIYRIFRF
jgi:glucose/arabinose dehydrogenase